MSCIDRRHPSLLVQKTVSINHQAVQLTLHQCRICSDIRHQSFPPLVLQRIPPKSFHQYIYYIGAEELNGLKSIPTDTVRRPCMPNPLVRLLMVQFRCNNVVLVPKELFHRYIFLGIKVFRHYFTSNTDKYCPSVKVPHEYRES